MSPSPSAAETTVTSLPARLGALGCINLAFVVTLIAAGTAHLWPQWLHNPDLSHGWFMPLIFALLVHDARTRAPQRFLPRKPLTVAALAVCLLAGLCLVVVGGLYLAALEWTHSLVAMTLTAALCALLAAAWIGFAMENVKAVPFNWTAGVAIFLWLLTAPLPPGTYATLTRELQLWVTDVVLASLHLLGIAAMKNGNVIQLADVSVGVEEACSGVRSLISCVFAGFFFSATLVRRPWARAVVIGLSAPLAIGMNVARSLLLTLLAHGGVEIHGFWHDATGFGILAITAGLLAALAVGLEKRRSQAEADATSIARADLPRAPAARLPQAILTSGFTVAVVIAALLILNTRPAVHPDRAAPDLSALLPREYTGWETSTNDELFRFSAQLQTEHLAQRTYTRDTPQGPVQITVYLAYWPVGQVPVSLVASHTPDACWPGVGWKPAPARQPTGSVTMGGRELEYPEHRLFLREGYPQHVWYWHLFDGRVIHHAGVGSPRKLFLLALRYGFHRDGEQLFVRVSSNQPWEKIAAEPVLKEIFARLEPFGL